MQQEGSNINCSHVWSNSASERPLPVLGVVHHQPGPAPVQPPPGLHGHQLRGRQTDHRQQGEGGAAQD